MIFPHYLNYLETYWAIREVSLSEYNMMWLLFGQRLVKILLILIPLSGHTAYKHNNSLREEI